jgi:hypothetical protein
MKLFRVVSERLLMIFQSGSRMSRLKKKVAHPDEAWKVFWIYAQTGFQMLSCLFKIIAL